MENPENPNLKESEWNGEKRSSFQLSSSNFALKVFDIGQSSFFSNYRRSHYYLKYDWTMGNMKGSAENTFPIRPHPFPVVFYSTYCPSIRSRSCLSWVRGSCCSAAENLDWDWPVTDSRSSRNPIGPYVWLPRCSTKGGRLHCCIRVVLLLYNSLVERLD